MPSFIAGKPAGGVPYKLKLATLLLGAAAAQATALDLSFNGRQIGLLGDEILLAHSWSDPDRDGAPSVALAGFFPWLESLEHAEFQSESELVSWDGAELDMDGWNSADLVLRTGIWDLEVNGELIAAPERIAIVGSRLETPVLRIWTALDDDAFETELKNTLAFRGVKVSWRRVKQPGSLLSDPPMAARPHLLLLNDLDAIALQPWLISYRRVALGGEIPPLPGTVNLLPSSYACIPRGLGETDRLAAEKLYKDAIRASRWDNLPAGQFLPFDPLTVRFFRAHTRLGRLAASGQMDADTAAALIEAVIRE